MRVKGSKFFGIGLALVILAVGIQGQIALGDDPQPPCTITVAPGQSIQEAIDSAPAGAAICLEPGEWKENLTIEKSITLRGAGRDKTVINGKTVGQSVIQILGSGVEVNIAGLTVTGAKARGETTDADGILIIGAEVDVQNAKISRNADAGIHLECPSKVTIRNSEISGNSDGIQLEGPSQATIYSSQILRNGWGILMEGSSQAKIAGSQISDNADGIDTCGSSKATISGAEISASVVGVLVEDASQAVISKAKVWGNGFGIWVGIGLEEFGQLEEEIATKKTPTLGSSKATISESEISGNGLGIWVTGPSKVVIRGNRIFENASGIALEQKSCLKPEENEPKTPEKVEALVEFAGKVEGSGNEIHDNFEEDVCPAKLKFLTTQKGGCYGPGCAKAH